MRGLTKGAPPPNVSPPLQQPRSLADANAQYQGELATATNQTKYSRSQFDDLHKRALRDVLFVEQKYLCIYCESGIDEVHPPPPVDHWNSLDLYPLEVFEWNNLHLSCRSVDTCDDRKKSKALNLPWPVTFAYEKFLGFTSGGRMYVRTDIQIPPPLRAALELAIEDSNTGGVTTQSTLNLNQPALREARAAAIDDEEEAMSTAIRAQTTMAQRQARAANILNQARRPQFVSIRVAWLLDMIGTGR